MAAPLHLHLLASFRFAQPTLCAPQVEQNCFLRVYVLRGHNLSARDFDLSGNPLASDPYLKVRASLSRLFCTFVFLCVVYFVYTLDFMVFLQKVSLTKPNLPFSSPPTQVSVGGHSASTRSRYIKHNLNPEFYEAFEFPITLPGVICCDLQTRGRQRENRAGRHADGSVDVDPRVSSARVEYVCKILQSIVSRMCLCLCRRVPIEPCLSIFCLSRGRSAHSGSLGLVIPLYSFTIC